MLIGVLKETLPTESRVALTPAAVRRLSEHGHRVVVEHTAGDGAHFPDEAYAAAGGQIAFTAAEVCDRAELLVKVERPTRAESELLHVHQAVMAFYHFAVASRDELSLALERSITAIGLELIQTAEGRLPVLEPMSEIGGQFAVAVASHLLRSTSGGRGILLGGAPGIAPARVVILGGGTVGTWAARSAVGNGASTLVLDNDPAKLRRLQWTVPSATTGLADADAVREAVCGADVVIGAVLLPGERTPTVVTRDMVERMRPGAAIIDVSIDQGGCVETSRPTTLAAPVFAHSGVLHYCVPNMTADIARTASTALSQAALHYILELAGLGVERALGHAGELARGVYTFDGHVVNLPLADRWRMDHRDLHTLLARKESVAL
jgi:alanine dehydrogenase